MERQSIQSKLRKLVEVMEPLDGSMSSNESSDDGTAIMTPTTSHSDSSSVAAGINADPVSKPQNAEEGPFMALDCPSLDFYALYELYWTSRDSALRRRIFWRLWGSDPAFLDLVQTANKLLSNGNTLNVNHWVRSVYLRRRWHPDSFGGYWQGLTAMELSNMAIRQLKWILRKNSVNWFFRHSSSTADLPARDVAVALAVSDTIPKTLYLPLPLAEDAV